MKQQITQQDGINLKSMNFHSSPHQPCRILWNSINRGISTRSVLLQAEKVENIAGLSREESDLQS